MKIEVAVSRLDEIARDIAREAIAEAEANGWQFLESRSPFYSSDMRKLADQILIWLQDHMEPDQG